MRAAGNHTRVASEEVRTSTRVVTSNVRQPLGAALAANRRAVFGIARLADAIPADRRKSRRFMITSSAPRGFGAQHRGSQKIRDLAPQFLGSDHSDVS